MTFSKLRLLFLLGLFAIPAAVLAQSREEARLILATKVVEDMSAMPDQRAPDWLLARSHGIAVIPSVIKVGLGIGGRRGKGVLVVRNAQGGWSNPVFVALTGGSFGWQAGVQSTDVILVFTTAKGVQGISDGKVTLGADASAAAGPVGRQTSAATDPSFSAEIYSYSRASGLFAGVAIDGSAVTIDSKANEAFYGKPGVTPEEIFAGTVQAATAEPAVRRFVDTLDQSTRAASTTPATEAPKASTTPEPAGTKDEPAAKSEAPTAPAKPGAETYPMEDPNPGQEPPH